MTEALPDSDVAIGPDQPAPYEIRFQGRLDEGWSDWFPDMDMVVAERVGTATTTLSGIVADQAALHGLLDRIANLNLVLLSVKHRAELRDR